MKISLTLEDGTVVQGANTYVSRDEAVQHLEGLGTTLPECCDLNTLIVGSFNYINTMRDKFPGTPVSREQTGAYPRNNACLQDGTALGSDEIPVELKRAQLSLINSMVNGLELPTFLSDRTVVIEEQIGPLKEKRSEKVGLSSTPRLSEFDSIIAPLLKTSRGRFGSIPLMRG